MKHLTLSDRIRIESMLETDCSFSVMARELNRSPSTISREIRKHRSVVPHYSNPSGRKRSQCEHAKSCRIQFLCGNPHCSSFCSKCRSKRCTLYCSLFSPRKCERLKQPPMSVITFQNFAPVPTISTFTEPNMPMTFTTILKPFPVQASIRPLNHWNSWTNWFLHS